MGKSLYNWINHIIKIEWIAFDLAILNLTAVRYIAMNPVKCGLTKRPEQYRWSSTVAYLSGKNDTLIQVCGLHKMVDNWSQFFREGMDYESAQRLQRHEKTGRPLGEANYVVKLERILDRILLPQKAGRKPNKK